MSDPQQYMEKYIDFSLSDDNACLVGHGVPLIKTAGEMHPEVQAYVSRLQAAPKDPGKIYILVTALGAGEYYGSNTNGDYFPEEALMHEPAAWKSAPKDPSGRRAWVDEYIKNPAKYGDKYAYGYLTFYTAGIFRHHKNKEPDKSFGAVTLSIYNKNMHRVELIIALDRKKAAEVGADSVIADIDAGKFPPMSMGCRVPWDVCSICGNRAPTRAQYCDHARLHMNEVMPDGRKVCVINTYPRFFDDSFVWVNADKIAWMMMKVAKDTTVIEEGALPFYTEKTAAAVKRAAISKVVSPDSPWSRAIALVGAKDTPLPSQFLDSLPEDLTAALRTLFSSGVILSPQEFTRVVLVRGGKRDLADSLDRSRSLYFRHGAAPLEAPTLLGSGPLPLNMGHRSVLGPDVVRRMMVVRAVESPERLTVLPPSSAGRQAPLFDRISGAYSGYRRRAVADMLHMPNLPAVPDGLGNPIAKSIFGDLAGQLCCALRILIPLTMALYAYTDEPVPVNVHELVEKLLRRV